MSLKPGFWQHFCKVPFHYHLILFAFQEASERKINYWDGIFEATVNGKCDFLAIFLDLLAHLSGEKSPANWNYS